MEEQIKLIWDFRGPSASLTAIHHQKHLEEFCVQENHSTVEAGYKDLSDMHSTAYIIVPKEKMIIIRDALKPHRGEKIV